MRGGDGGVANGDDVQREAIRRDAPERHAGYRGNQSHMLAANHADARHNRPCGPDGRSGDPDGGGDGSPAVKPAKPLARNREMNYTDLLTTVAKLVPVATALINTVKEEPLNPAIAKLAPIAAELIGTIQTIHNATAQSHPQVWDHVRTEWNTAVTEWNAMQGAGKTTKA